MAAIQYPTEASDPVRSSYTTGNPWTDPATGKQWLWSVAKGRWSPVAAGTDLTAGTGITIVDGVISSTGGTYTAGTGLTLTTGAFAIDSTVATLTGTQTLTNKTLTAPALGTPASGILTNCTFPTLNQSTTGNAATVTGLSITAGKTLAATQTITLTGTDSTVMTLPATSANLARTDDGGGTQTFSGPQAFSGQIGSSGSTDATVSTNVVNVATNDARYAVAPIVAYATADLDRDTTVTLAADSALALALTAGVWEVTGRVHISESVVSNAVGAKARLDVTANASSAGSSVYFELRTGSNPNSFTSTSKPAVSFTTIFPTSELGATSSRCTFMVSAVVKMTGAGTLNFEWAQNVSNATPNRRYSGSYMIARKIGS